MKSWQKVVLAVLVVSIIGVASYPKFGNNFSPDVATTAAVACTFKDGECTCPLDNPTYNGCGDAPNAASCELATCGGNPTPYCKCVVPNSVTETYNSGGITQTVSYSFTAVVRDDCYKSSSASTCSQEICVARYKVAPNSPSSSQITKTFPCSWR